MQLLMLLSTMTRFPFSRRVQAYFLAIGCLAGHVMPVITSFS